LRKLLASILVLVVFSLGSGVMASLHAWQHQIEDTCRDHSGETPVKHDSGNCSIHAALEAPMSMDMCDLRIASIEFAQRVVAEVIETRDHRFAEHISCRGPPART